MSCTNNLKQLGLALHNYHDTFKAFPSMGQGTNTGSPPEATSTYGGMSGVVVLLPYLEQIGLYNQYKSPQASPLPVYPAWGPVPWYGWNFEPHHAQPPTLLCPSDGGGKFRSGTPYWWQGDTNYNFCFGDYPGRQPEGWTGGTNPRGMFGKYSFVTFGEIRDGTSNTIAMSEHVISSVDPAPAPSALPSIHGFYVTTNDWQDYAVNPAASCYIYKGPGTTILDTAPAIGNLRGVNWCWGGAVISGFNTVLPPNSVGCSNWSSEWGDGHILPPDSSHPTGVNAVFGDGSVRFISENIDVGDLTLPGRTTGMSPYGVWGAMGSKNGGDQGTEQQ
jgi:prepilin-type processing-associated H-X9-DG protein